MVSMRTRPWCALCRFDFADGEDVVNVTSDPANTPRQSYSSNKLRIRKARESHEHQSQGKSDWNNAQGEGEGEGEDEPNMHYSGLCRPTLENIPTNQLIEYCHYDCVKHFDPLVLAKILKMIAYEFVPSAPEREKRQQWLRTTFAQILHDRKHCDEIPSPPKPFDALVARWVQRMPVELLLQSLDYCLPRFTLAQTVAATSFSHSPSTGSVQAQRCIWATYVALEGNWYISTLTNERGDSKGSILIWKPDGLAKVMHIARDHLGIRKITLAPKKSNVISCSGLWWVAIPLEEHTTFTCKSDGLKLRQLVFSDSSEALWNTLWAVPKCTDMRLYLLPNHESSAGFPIKQMNFFECEPSTVQGYSAHWDGRLITIHTHHYGKEGGEDEHSYPHRAEDLTFYRAWTAGHPHTVWLYMPMDRDEMVSEIWIRFVYRSTPILFMKTDKDRVWEIGPRPKLELPFQWRLLSESRNEHKVFFEESRTGIGQMCFQTPSPVHQPPPPAVIPQSTYPPTMRTEQFFYTSASLTDIKAFSMCMKEECIIGLLFYYHDGCERAVGQTRFDLLQPVKRTNGARGLAYKLSPIGRHVVGLQLASGDEDETWEILPWKGSLAWWFSAIGCKLSYTKE